MDHLGHGVPTVHIDGADAHHLSTTHKVNFCLLNLLPIPFAEVAKEQADERVQLPDLLLVVILQSILVALFQSMEGIVHFQRPKDLGASQSNLGQESKRPLSKDCLGRVELKPLLPWSVLVRLHRSSEGSPVTWKGWTTIPSVSLEFTNK